MRKIFAILLVGLVVFLFTGIGLQLLWLFYINRGGDIVVLFQQLPILDFSLYFIDSSTNALFYTIVILSIVIMVPILIGAFFDPGKPLFKSKYDKKSYRHLMSRAKRKRGTIRVQYTDEGKITEKTLEWYFDYLKLPLTKLQNAWCKMWLLPETRKLNTIKKYNINGKMQHHIAGIPIIAYRKYYLFGKFNRIHYLPARHHNMFIGSTGRGKSFSFVLNMLTSMAHSGENMVVHDTKHELIAYMKPLLKELGYKTIVLNFDSPGAGDGWNPLAYPYYYWQKALKEAEESGEEANVSRAVELILDIARALAFEEDARQPFFWQGAAEMIAGAAELLFEEGKEEYINFKSIKYIYQLGDDNEEGRATLIAKFLNKYRPIDSSSGSKMKTFLDSKGLTKSSLKSVFQNKVNLLTSTEDIMRMTSKSTFDIRDIFQEKTAVFILTQDEKSTYYPLVTMFLKQLYEVGIRITKENPEGRKLNIPMHWMIDELAILPEVMDVENIFSAAKSRGLYISGFIQSIPQLEDKYESKIAKVMLDNCNNIIYLGSGTAETQNYFVEKAGKERVYDKETGKYIVRDIMTSDRLNLMETGRTLLTSIEWNPYIIKIPPFEEYVFATKPDWTLDKYKRPEVKFFNIVEEYKNKQKKGYDEADIQPITFESIE